MWDQRMGAIALTIALAAACGSDSGGGGSNSAVNSRNANPNSQQGNNSTNPNGSTLTYERPVVVDPCTVLAAADVAAAVNEPSFDEPPPNEPATDSSPSYWCSWTREPMVTPTTDGSITVSGASVQATAARASTSKGDFDEAEWEEWAAGATDMTEVDWSPNGRIAFETAVDDAGNEYKSAKMHAFIINTDPASRHVWITMNIYVGGTTVADYNTDIEMHTAAPIDPEVQRAALLDLGKQLSDAIRAAQPAGVTLPDVGG